MSTNDLSLSSQTEDEFDMIVLSLGLEPSATLQEQAQRMGVVLNRWGFAQTSELCPLDTSRPGVFVGGAFQEPKDIPDTVMQASAAAARAMALLAPARGTRVRTKTYPPQRDISRRAAADRRVHLPLRQQHRLGGRRRAGGQADPRVAVRRRGRKQHLHLRRRHAEPHQGPDSPAPA